MSETFKRKVLVTLNECSHTLTMDWQYRPTEGDSLYCFRCNHYRTMKGLLDQFTVACSGCRYTRSKGRAKLNAEIDASKHHRKHPDHEVKLYEGARVVHTWKVTQNKIPGLDQVFTQEGLPLPPF